MSKKCLFERASGLFESGTSFDDIPHDPVTHIQLTLDDYPDRRTERWDGVEPPGGGTRPATAQEIADFDEAENETRAGGELATPLNLTLRDLFLDIETRLRAAGETSGIQVIADASDPPAYTAALKTILKSHL